ncbi:hypothetical protein ACSBR2_038446 [Camellia fascicularis]
MAIGFRLIFATYLLLMLLDICKGSKVGVCYGRNADDLPTPDKVAQLVQLHNIKYLRIYDSNIQVLKAFANTGVELMVGITNSDLLPFSQFQSNADTWLKNNILPYYPATKITYITVGAEVTEAPNNVSAMIDALYFALMALNFRTIKIMVTETGWPSKGSAKETAATPDNAQTYNTNLIRHVINDTGTPAKPGEALDAYIFSLFNENRKPGLESERNWGLFYPDQTSVYSLDFSGRGAVDMTTQANVTRSNGTWCIASSTASEVDLQSALDWACGPGNVDCSAIQPSQPCFEPDNLVSHASYAFNSYYQQNGATDIACGFGGAGVKTNKNPSYDNCLYMIAGSNKTAASTVTAVPSTSSSIQTVLSLWISSCLLLLTFLPFF